jgi:hypothetical protein
MILDAFIYVTIAVSAYLMTQLGSDEASKYIDAQWLFYLKTANGSLSAGSLAVKLFRSEVFSKWKQNKQNGNGKHEATPVAGG